MLLLSLVFLLPFFVFPASGSTDGPPPDSEDGTDGSGIDSFTSMWLIVPGPCSSTCGDGTQLVEAQCRNMTNNAPVPEILCDGQRKPLSFRQNCNEGPCPRNWTTGEWSACSETCSGMRRRPVYCEVVENGEVIRVSAEECASVGPQPESEQRCGFPRGLCPVYKWNTTEWSECSVECGVGSQTRQITCVQESITGKETATDKECQDRVETGPRPQREQACERECRFVPSAWSACSFPPPMKCGQGSRARNLSCIEILRNGTEIPKDVESCEPGAVVRLSIRDICHVECRCTAPEWAAMPWSSCTRTCGGGGEQQRGIRCNCSIGGGPGQFVNEEECVKLLGMESRPSIRQECGFEQCPCISPRWESNPWSKCPVTCGNGQQIRNSTCVCFRDGVREEDKGETKCGRRPSPTQPCYRPRCECPKAKWNFTRVGECSQTCGNGTRSRVATCLCEGKPTDDIACIINDGLPKPLPYEPCYEGECQCEDYRFRVGEWTPCNKPCGDDAVQTRRVTCTCKMEGEIQEEQAEMCEAALRVTEPARTQSCSKKCPCERVQYRASNWGPCQAACGNSADRRVQTRAVRCYCSRDGTETVVDDSYCDQHLIHRPPTRQPCSAPCWFGWKRSSWSPCNADCHRHREVKCVVELTNVEVNESNCYALAKRIKPETLERCQYVGSKVRLVWRTSAFSPCSANCGLGTKKRAVLCVNPCKNERAKGCKLRNRPRPRQTCFQAPCGGECRDRKNKKYCRMMVSSRFCNLDLNFFKCCKSCRSYRRE